MPDEKKEPDQNDLRHLKYEVGQEISGLEEKKERPKNEE
jgi:hypothetical protein